MSKVDRERERKVKGSGKDVSERKSKKAAKIH